MPADRGRRRPPLAAAGAARPVRRLAPAPTVCLPPPLPATKVLRITGGIERLFDRYADEAAQQRFKRRLDLYGAIWCCVNAHPGHVWCASELGAAAWGGNERAWRGTAVRSG